MTRWIKWILAVGLVSPAAAIAQNAAITDFCTSGATNAVTQGLSSGNTLQGVVPSCTVTVYNTGTVNLATIYSNVGGATLSNPFTASQIGQFVFYAPTSACYDIVLSGGASPNTFPSPVVLTDKCPGGGGGGSSPTAAAIAAAIQTQTGCNTAGYVWIPQSNTCVANGGSGGGVSLTPSSSQFITNPAYQFAAANDATTINAALYSGSGATAQLTNAIAAAISSGANAVRIPCGTYALTSEVVVSITATYAPPLRIYGDGPCTIFTTNNTGAFHFEGTPGVTLANLLFENMSIVPSVPTTAYNVRVDGLAGFTFRNINMLQASAIGYQFNGSQQGEVDGGMIGIPGAGPAKAFDFEASGGTHSNTIEVHGTQIFVYGASATAFYVNSSDDLEIHGNSIVGNTAGSSPTCTGLYQNTAGNGYVNFHDNHLEGCTQGAYISQARIVNNSFFDRQVTGTTSVEVYGGSGNVIQNNLLQGAVKIDSGSKATNYSGNTAAGTFDTFTDNGFLTLIYGNAGYTNGPSGLGSKLEGPTLITSENASGGDILTLNPYSANIDQGITVNGAGSARIYHKFGSAGAVWSQNGGVGVNLGSSAFTPWLTVNSSGLQLLTCASGTYVKADGTGCGTPGGGGGTTTNPVTFAASGGAAPGTTFNGAAAVTVSATTVGAATPSAIQQSAYLTSPDTGTANAYIMASITPTPTVVSGSEVHLVPANANTGAATLTVAGTTSPIVKKSAAGPVPLVSGDLVPLQSYTLTYIPSAGWEAVGSTSSGGSGTVTSSPSGQFAVYAGTGTVVAGDAAWSDNGTNLVATEPINSTASGTNAGYDFLTGNISEPALPSNVAGWIGPNAASFTSYGLQLPSASPSATAGSPNCSSQVGSSAVWQCSFVSDAIQNQPNAFTGQNVFSSSPIGTVNTPATLFSGTPIAGATFNPPVVGIEPAGVLPSRSANGTMLEVVPPTGFTGNALFVGLPSGAAGLTVNYQGAGQFASTLGATSYQVSSTGGLNWSNAASPGSTKDTNVCRGGSGGLVFMETGTTCSNALTTANAGLGSGSLIQAQIASGPTPTITQTGTTGSTTWSYVVVPLDINLQPSGSGTAGSISTGPTGLNGVNYNTITWAAVPGAYRYAVYRTASGSGNPTLGQIASNTVNLTLNDTGLTANGATPPSANLTGSFSTFNALIGASGVSGQAVFGNSTSGTTTLTAATGALLGGIVQLPNVSGTDTLASLAATQALTNKSVNGVTLSAAGSTTAYLNQAGAYTTPQGSNYQTVQDAGTALPQEPVLNLIAGTNATINCVDNASVATNCTFIGTSTTAATAWSAITSGTNAQTLLTSGSIGTTGGGTIAATSAVNLAGGSANGVPYQTGAGATGFIASCVGGLFQTNGSSVPSCGSTLAQALAFTGNETFSGTTAASTPAVEINAAPYAGTASNSYGSLDITSGTPASIASLNTAGTYFTIRAPSANTSDLVNLYNGTTSVFKLSSLGALTVNNTVGATGITASSAGNSIYLPSSSSATTTNVAYLQFAGSTTNNLRAGFAGVASSTLGVGTNYSNVIVGQSPITTAASGTHSWLVNVAITPMGTVTNGGATVTNTANLRVGSPSSGGTNNYSIFADGPVATTSSIVNNAVQTTVSCSTSGSTSGSATFSEPEQGTSYKKVLIHFSACVGTATYTFPTPFINTPSVFGSNNVAASVVTSVSTTAVTVTGATTTGALKLEDF